MTTWVEISNIVWLCASLVYLALSTVSYKQALRDERALFLENINGTARMYANVAVQQEALRLAVALLFCLGGVLRVFVLANQPEIAIVTGAIVTAICSVLSWSSLRALQVRQRLLAYTQATRAGETAFLSRSSLLEAVWATVPIVIVELDTGTILQATRPAEQMLGYQMVGDLRGRSVEDLLPDDLRALHVEHRQKFAANPQTRPMGQMGSLLHAKRRDGSVFSVEIGLCAAIIEGQRCAIAVLSDADRRVPGTQH